MKQSTAMHAGASGGLTSWFPALHSHARYARILDYLGHLTDDEVREIQAAVSAIRPGAIVNIGAVVTGCPCEDGPSCSDQVWVVAYRPEKSTGFNLSNVNHHWILGISQSWWLEYENLQASRRTFASWAAYLDAEQDLFKRFPACPESNLPAALSPAIAPAFPLIAR